MHVETHSSLLGLLQHETGPGNAASTDVIAHASLRIFADLTLFARTRVCTVLPGLSGPVPYGLSGQTNGGQHPHHHHADSSVPHWAPPADVTANADTTGGHEPAFDGGVPFSPLLDWPEVAAACIQSVAVMTHLMIDSAPR